MVHRAFTSQAMSELVTRIVATYEDDRGINHIEGLPIPDRSEILRAVEELKFILFPGFSSSRTVSHTNIEYMVGNALDAAFGILAREIETSFHYMCRLQRCSECDCPATARAAATRLLTRLPEIRELLKTDVEAAYNGDPAATSLDEIILAYPGIQAIALHRIAHELYRVRVPLIPRIIAEHAHAATGIDIHPGARIGPSFFIDHGTGVVIGETTEIGRNAKVYMGVTLGALAPAKGQSLRDTKRHPTIEDDVTIYAGATILGGETVIGQGSTIGGNVWLTKSVPPYTRVLLSNPELVFVGKKREGGAGGPRPKQEWNCPACASAAAARGTAPVCENKGARTAKTQAKRNPKTKPKTEAGVTKRPRRGRG